MGILKTYTISTDVTGGVVDAPDLNTEIANSGHVTGFTGLSVSGDSLEIFGDSFISETSLDTLVQNHVAVTLDEYKTAKNEAIDKRTGELISLGYTYASKQFSLSANAQTNILALFATKDNPALTYPIKYNTIDDADSYDVVDATDLENMYLTALAAKKGHVDSGTTLKDSVRAAVDKAGVDAVVDNR